MFVWNVVSYCIERQKRAERGKTSHTHASSSPTRRSRWTGRGQTNEHSLLLSSSPFIMLSRTCTALRCTAAAQIGQTHILYEPCQWLQRMPKGSSLQMFTEDIWHVLNCSCTGQSLLVTHTQSCSLPSLSLICSLFLQVFSFSGVSVHVTKDSRAHSIHAAFFWGFGTGRGTKREFKPFKSWRC